MNDFLKKHSPPGLELKPELSVFLFGNIISMLFSFLIYSTAYVSARRELYYYSGGEYFLDKNATIPSFELLIGHSFDGFIILSLLTIGFAIYHYAYYRQGSKSIYLMKRLPNRKELHRRALTLPMLFASFSLTLALVLSIIYFAIYAIATPDACLPPDIFEEYWRLFYA